MALKPAKLRCFMLTDDTFQQDITIYVPKSNIDVSIPSISNQPVKFFGRTNSFTVSGKDQMEVISLAVSKGLALINNLFIKECKKFGFSNTYLCLGCADLCSFMRFLHQQFHVQNKIYLVTSENG